MRRGGSRSTTQWRKVKCSQCIFSGRQFEDAFENTQWRKVKQMQPMWLCLFSARPFEETFEITQWRKIKQMQPVWLCLLWPKFFDETHKQAQSRRKVTIWHREQTLWCINIDEININILHNDKGKLFCFLQRGAKKLGSKLMMTIIRGGVKNPSHGYILLTEIFC